jgi:hypothetical protein
MVLITRRYLSLYRLQVNLRRTAKGTFPGIREIGRPGSCRDSGSRVSLLSIIGIHIADIAAIQGHHLRHESSVMMNVPASRHAEAQRTGSVQHTVGRLPGSWTSSFSGRITERDIIHLPEKSCSLSLLILTKAENEPFTICRKIQVAPLSFFLQRKRLYSGRQSPIQDGIF